MKTRFELIFMILFIVLFSQLVLGINNINQTFVMGDGNGSMTYVDKEMPTLIRGGSQLGFIGSVTLDPGVLERTLMNWSYTCDYFDGSVSIVSVQLQLNVFEGREGGTSVKIYPVNKSWDQDVINWNNSNGMTGEYNDSWLLNEEFTGDFDLDDDFTGLNINFTLNSSWYSMYCGQSEGIGDFDEGLLIEGYEISSNHFASFRSEEITDKPGRPHLFVTYFSNELPMNSSFNITSGFLFGNSSAWENGSVVSVTGNELSGTFNTNIDANCSIGLSDVNYTTAVANNSDFMMATTETTSHAFTLFSNLSIGEQCVYVSCIDTVNGFQSNVSNSGCLLVNHINTVPFITNLSIAPSFAVSNDNLSGSLINHDNNTLDNVDNFFMWFVNGVNLVNTTNLSSVWTSSNDNIMFSVRAFDGFVNGSWFNSSNITLDDVISPKLENFSLSIDSGEINDAFVIFVDCFDDGGGLFVNYPFVSVFFGDTLKINQSMSFVNGDRYSTSYIPNEVGNYNFTFYCNDASGNSILNRSNGFIYVAVDTPVVPFGGGGGGGGGVVVVDDLSDLVFCGNNFCEGNENVFNCALDCAPVVGNVTIDDVLCTGDRCIWKEAGFTTSLIVLILIGLFVFPFRGNIIVFFRRIGK